LDSAQRELMHHIEAIEQNIREIQQQLIDHLPFFAESYPQHSPGTLHQFQQIILLLHDMQAHEAGNAPGTRPSLSLEDQKLFQEENLLQYVMFAFQFVFIYKWGKLMILLDLVIRTISPACLTSRLLFQLCLLSRSMALMGNRSLTSPRLVRISRSLGVRVPTSIVRRMV